MLALILALLSVLSFHSHAVQANTPRATLLDITFTQSGMAAYPDEHSKHFLINLKDGSLVKASEVFDPSKLVALAAMVDSKLQSELKQIARENAWNDMEASDKESLREAHANLKFEVTNLAGC